MSFLEWCCEEENCKRVDIVGETCRFIRAMVDEGELRLGQSFHCDAVFDRIRFKVKRTSWADEHERDTVINGLYATCGEWVVYWRVAMLP